MNLYYGFSIKKGLLRDSRRGENSMIQQHMYTRSREGLTSTTVGYDSIAKSNGLSIGVVQSDYLRSLYKYSVPLTISSDDVNIEEFPKSIYGISMPDGYFVLGQNKYKDDEYSQGTRSAFFSHQYYIPHAEMNDFYQNPKKLFQVTSFEGVYDLEKGKVLPTVEDIPHQENDINGLELLNRLGIDEQYFQQLLLASFMSIQNGKTVYITLDVPVTRLTENALQLLELIFRCLPYAIRKQLGFNTYTNNTRVHQKMNIVFLENGSLDGQAVPNHYVFDFNRQAFNLLHELPKSALFIPFVSKNIDDLERIDQFFEFAEESLADIPDEEKNRLALYEQMAELYFSFQEGDDSQLDNESERIKRYELISIFVSNGSIDQKPQIKELLTKLVRKDYVLLKSNSSHPTDRIKELYITLYRAEALKLNVASALIASWINVTELEKIPTVLESLSQDQILFDEVTSTILSNRRKGMGVAAKGFEAWLLDRFISMGSVQHKLNILEQYVQKAPFFFADGEFIHLKNHLKSAFVQSIQNSKNPVSDIRNLYKFLYHLPIEQEHEQEFEHFLDEVLPEALEQLFLHHDLLQLIKQDINSFGILFKGKLIHSNHFKAFNQEAYDKVNLIKDLLEILEKSEDDNFWNDSPSEFYNRFDNRNQVNQFQTMLRELLKNIVAEDLFNPILFAFYNPTEKSNSTNNSYLTDRYDNEHAQQLEDRIGSKREKLQDKEIQSSTKPYDFQGVFTYLFDAPYDDGKLNSVMVSAFIRWACVTTDIGMNERIPDRLDSSFREALMYYFAKLDQAALFNSRLIKDLKTLEISDLDRTLEKLQWENANLLERAKLRITSIIGR
jgi:hypothetical protein